MTNKRKFEDAEEGEEARKTLPKEALVPGENVSVPGKSGRAMQGQGDDKHTIDSDDEEDEREREKEFEKLRDDDIEGQEDNTMGQDGEITITPFNLKEEQQEGTFSKDGNFVWNDKKDEIKDAWLDDIDWMKVKQKSLNEKTRLEEEDEKEDEEQEKYSEMDAYRSILVLLKPGESVAKALRRLGGGKKAMSASERWKKKKSGAVEDPQEKINKENMLKLTGLADSILTRSGNMEVYEETYESITFNLEKEKKTAAAKTAIPEDVDDDDALDMFADSLDDTTTKGAKDDKPEIKAGNGAGNGAVVSKQPVVDLDAAVMWEFKWKNEEGSEVHGPHDSSKMLEWQESDFFKDGVWCRKVGGSSEFTTSKRIDFDLYT